MSNVIEDRVVEMRFDNSQFESGVKTSLSTLKELKDSLNFDGATKGLASIANAGKSLTFNSLSVAVEGVGEKFSALEQIAIGALRKIGEQAIEAGEKLIKSMSVDQISAGWQKFADETTSVGTIVGQGYDMSVVEEQLAKLNWYTDETSYNFVDMVSNIGKFTATGQDLEESVTAMMGIANWAAASGQNAGVASRAMYQLAQAMGKGSLRYDDFRSIQNANMDTKEFREQSLLAAEALGKVRKEADGTYTVLASGANFTFAEMFASDALTRQMWYTSDVMMEVFGKYSSAVEDIYNYAEEHGVTASEAIQALSGTLDENARRWFESAQEARTWGDVVDSVNDAVSTKWKNVFKQIFGNYEEAKTVWTWWSNELYNVFSEPIEGLVEIFSLWHDVGGAFLNAMAIKELWENLGFAVGIVKRQFLDVFGLDHSAAKWANIILNMTQGFYDFAESTQLSYSEMKELKNVANVVFTVLYKVSSIVKTVVVRAFQTLKTVVDAARSAFQRVIPESFLDNLYGFLDSVYAMVDGFKLSDTAVQNLERTFAGLWAVLDLVGQVFFAIWDVFAGPFFGTLGDVGGGILDLTGNLGDFLVGLDESARQTDFFHTALTNVRDVITTIISKIQEIYTTVKTTIMKFVDRLKESEEFNQFLSKLNEFKDWAIDMATALKDLAFEKFSEWFEKAKTYMPTMDDITKAIEDFVATINGFVNAFQNGGWSGAKEFLAGLFGDITVEDMPSKIITVVKDFIIKVFSDEDVVSEAQSGVETLLGKIVETVEAYFSGMFEDIGLSDIFEALNLVALLKIATGLGKFFGSISSFMDGSAKIPGAVVNVLNTLANTIGSYQMKLNADALLKIAGAILVLAIALNGLSKIPVEKLDGAVVALSFLMVAMIPLVKSMSSMFSALAGFKADHLANLADGVSKFLKKIGTAAIILAAGTAFLEIAAGLVIVIAAIKMLANALKKDGEHIWQALDILTGVVGGIMAAFAALAWIQAAGVNTKSLSGVGLAFIGVAAGMILIAEAMKMVANIDMSSSGLAIAALTGIAAGLVIMLAVMSKCESINAGVGAFIGLSAAVLVLSIAMRLMSEVPWQTALASAVGIALVMAASVAAMTVIDKFDLGNTAKTLVIIGAAMITFAAALAIVAQYGKDMDAVAMLWSLLAVSLVTLVGVAWLIKAAGVSEVFTAMATAILMIGGAVLAAGVGVLAFAAAMLLLEENSNAIPSVMAAIGNGIVAFGNAISGNVTALLLFIVTMVAVAAAAVAVGYAIAKIVQAMTIVAEQIKPFFEKIASAMPSAKTTIITALALLLVGLLDWLGVNIPELASSVVALVLIAIDSIAIALIENSQQIAKAVRGILTALGLLVLDLIDEIFGPILELLGFNLDGYREMLNESHTATVADLQSNINELQGTVDNGIGSIFNAAQDAADSQEPTDFSNIYEGVNSHEALVKAQAGGAEVADATVTGYNEEIQEGQVYSLELTTDSVIQESRNAGQQLAETEVDAYNQEVANADIPVVGENHAEDLQARTKTYGEATGEVYRRGVVDGVDGPVAEIEDALGLSEVDVETPAAESGYEYDAYLAQYMSENGYMVTDSANGISLDAAGAFLNPDAFGDSAYGNIGGMITGFNGGSGDLFGYITQLSGDSNNLLDFSSDAQSTGSTDSQAFAEGIASNEGNVTAAARGVSDAAANAFGDSYNSAFNSGSQVSTGFGAGMYSNQSAIYTAADTISTNAANRFSTGNTNAYNAGAGLGTQFATGITSKNTLAGLVGTMLANTATAKLNSQQSQGRTSGVTLGNVFAMGLRSMATTSAGSALVVLQSATSRLATGSESAYTSGFTLVNYFARGIQAGSGYPSGQAANIVNNISKAVGNAWSIGYNAGANFSKGMGSGISAYAYAAANAAAAVAARAAAAAKARLKINSPSKVGIEIGKFFDLGVALGMTNYAGRTEDAAETMSERILDSFNTITSRIADVLDGTMEIDPTIRPVLDLSEIQNGADQLSGILAGTSYAASASLGNIGNGGLMSQLAANLSAISARGNAGGTNTFNITVNAGDIDDPDELANLVADRIQLQILQKGAAI